MKRFSCGDVVPGCTTTFEAGTESGILALVAEHARTGHGLESVPPQLVDAVRARIHDVPQS